MRLPRWWGHALATSAAVLIVGGPSIFTRNGFMEDYTNHLWLVWVQAHAIAHHLVPTYFIDAPVVGVFYPIYMFYGGTLYAVTGALAALLGGRVDVAYVGLSLLAIAAAYVGPLWLSLQLGVRSWLAHAPAIAFVSSAYYVTNIYGRGAWPEFVATSMIPLLVAAGWRLASAELVEFGAAAVFVVSAALFAGSHNATLLLGTIILGLGIGLLRIAVGRALTPWGAARMLQIGGLLLLAVGLDGWYLIPTLVHGAQTQIALKPVFPWNLTAGFNAPGTLFNPLRTVPWYSTTPGLFVQVPDWTLLWALVCGVALRTRFTPRLRRAAGAVAVLLLGLLVLITIGPVWNAMPRVIRDVQFPFRLGTYLALCVSGLVLIAALALTRAREDRSSRWLPLGLVGAIGVSMGLALWQLWFVNDDVNVSYRNRDALFVSTHVTPRTWNDASSYADGGQPVVRAPATVVNFDPTAFESNHGTVTVDPPAGAAPFATNLAAGPDVVRVSGGLVRAGRTATGYAVLKRARPGSGTVSVTFSLAGGAPVTGRIISAISALALVLLGLSSAVAGTRNGRSAIAARYRQAA
jgi:hypothetical protein